MPDTEKLGFLVCECLYPAAVEPAAAARLDDVRLIAVQSDCTRQIKDWQEIERAAAAAGRFSCLPARVSQVRPWPMSHGDTYRSFNRVTEQSALSPNPAASDSGC
jgi:hypothetical protein